MLHYSRTDSHYLLYIYATIEGLFDPAATVALSDSATEEHRHWLKARAEDKAAWAEVERNFQKKMNDFVPDSVRKPNQRKIIITIKKHESV